MDITTVNLAVTGCQMLGSMVSVVVAYRQRQPVNLYLVGFLYGAGFVGFITGVKTLLVYAWLGRIRFF
jgi:ABC-type uncharacterized transport system permease subunit